MDPAQGETCFHRAVWISCRWLVAIILLLTLLPGQGRGGEYVIRTDANIVTGVDLSGSILLKHERLQFEGLARAVENDVFLEAATSGRFGRVAVAVFVWSNKTKQKNGRTVDNRR